jgi:hypothetical protein
MSKLGHVVEAVDKYNQFVLDQARSLRTLERYQGQDPHYSGTDWSGVTSIGFA